MSTQDPANGYAYWISPDGSSKVFYSLALLHAIDDSVNEAFRSIPRGGIETAGLLFGNRNNEGLWLEAFRPIQCQHAFGPSFVLSEQDLAGLREQISGTADSELSGLRPIGWFVGHTRSPLAMSDREAGWFNEFFPEPGSIALLVKPERFQPTRFGFLLRDSAGQIGTDASRSAVIMPSQGQGGEPDQRRLASIPATKLDTKLPATAAFNTAPVEGALKESGTVDDPSPLAIRQRPTSINSPTGPPIPMASVTPEVAPVVRTAVVPHHLAATPKRYEVEVQRSFSGLNLQSAAVLVLAAMLGCVAGYWAYLQLPSPVIPVTVREQSGRLMVEWPSAQTAGTGYAAIQVNDGQITPLSEEQKSAGQALITAPGGDLKIDLVARHWLRDSRGIVRYLRTARTPLSATQPR